MRRSRHAVLRSATADLHEDLERAVDAAGYFSSAASYGRYLQRLHRLHRVLTARATGSVAALFSDYAFDDRIVWLQDDLDRLGLAPLPMESGVPPLGMVIDRSAATGCLYVILGASLGARVLLRRANALALPDGAGKAYLTALAAAQDWPRFLDALETDDVLDLDSLVAGATATFGCFRTHLTEALAT